MYKISFNVSIGEVNYFVPENQVLSTLECLSMLAAEDVTVTFE